MKVPILTVYIAGRGTPLKEGGTSAFGHMWFSIEEEGSPLKNFGWASQPAFGGMLMKGFVP
jgi:hypothetical protein